MRRNDKTGLDELFAAHGARVYRFSLLLAGNREDAEDIASEVFLASAKAFESYRGEATPEVLLLQITRNKYRQLCRTHTRWLRHLQKSMRPELAPSHEEATLLGVAAGEALQRLSPALREAFLLVRVEGLRYAEAASVLGVPVGTVQSRVHTAASRLAAHLDPVPTPSFEEVRNEL
jgi:RNA polymerase sigma-70 factor, ECF subfamily